MLYGTSDAEPQTDHVVAQLSQELYNSNLLLLLIQVNEKFIRSIAGIHIINVMVRMRIYLHDSLYGIILMRQTSVRIRVIYLRR